MIVVEKKSVIVSMVMVAVFIGCGGVEVPDLNLRRALDQALVEKFGEDDELVHLKSEIILSDN